MALLRLCRIVSNSRIPCRLFVFVTQVKQVRHKPTKTNNPLTDINLHSQLIECQFKLNSNLAPSLYCNHLIMASSSLALLLSVASLVIYGYSINFLFFQADFSKINDLIPGPLRIFGQFKFMTIHCLIFQFINATLHFLAHFIRPLERIRDTFFTTLAYPIGSIVVYSFWMVWFAFGRELIYPAKLDSIYPTYINHAIHTIIVPINLLLCYSINYKFIRNGPVVTLSYLIAYVILLHYIKFETGYFVYGFLDTLDNVQRIFYYAVTAMFGYSIYRSGHYLNSLFHRGHRHHDQHQQSAGPAAKRRKQK